MASLMNSISEAKEEIRETRKDNCRNANRLIAIIAVIILGVVVSACSLDIKGDFRTRDGRPLTVKSSDNRIVQIPPGELKIFLDNGSPIFHGAVEIKNAAGKKIAEIEMPRNSKPGTLDFLIPGYEIGQKFDLMAHVRDLPERKRIYRKNDYSCTYCGECMDNDNIDEDYEPTFKERLDNGFKKIEKKDPKVQYNCKCSGTQQAILKDTTSGTQSSLYFLDGKTLIARFRSEPIELTATTVVKEVTKCGDHSKGISVGDVVEAVVPAVVDAIVE